MIVAVLVLCSSNIAISLLPVYSTFRQLRGLRKVSNACDFFLLITRTQAYDFFFSVFLADFQSPESTPKSKHTSVSKMVFTHDWKTYGWKLQKKEEIGGSARWLTADLQNVVT